MEQIYLQRILHKKLLNAPEKESFSSFFILCTVRPSRKYWILLIDHRLSAAYIHHK